MPTDCSPKPFSFAPVQGRQVIAAFDGGAITSDAGALLLGATDRAIRLVERFAACFSDHRAPEAVEHRISTLVGQRVFGIALLRRAECDARHLYETVYCARGEAENRIKECQLDLFADRTSAATMRANQLRLWFASMAYV